MRSLAISVLGFLVLVLASTAYSVDRRPTQAELDKIEQIRQMISQRGYTWEAGPTSVSHLSDAELDALLGLRIPPDFEARKIKARAEGRMIEEIPGMAFPPTFDWRTQGGVTPVKNQGNCGSCWAFCAVAAFESQVLLYSGVEENVSEQAILSCNTVGDGCDGGWMETAYDIFIDYGAVREACMPYHEVDTDPCIQTSCEVAADLDSYYYVDQTVNAIKTALLDGPVACAMAVCGGFSSYTGGCYEDVCTEINHGVTIVGWDDTMCGGAGAWIVKNSWGPDWGLNGYIYMKYGTCEIGYATEALNYTPGQTVHFFHDAHVIDDAAGDGDGMVEVGENIVLPVAILNIGAETATGVSAILRCLTSGVAVTDSTASFADIPKGETRQTNSPHFAFRVTPTGPSCGPLRFQMVVTSGQGESYINLVIQAGTIVAVFQDDFETNKGWTVGAAGDNATTGIWTRVDPNGTWWGDQPVQPENDHTASPGTQCFVTGQGTPGSSQGAADVDGGKTTLVSPALDLSNKDSALLSYYRWYASETGSAPNDDDFLVDVSNDNGSTWHNLETLTYADRTWRAKEFYLEDYLTLTGQMKVRFIAQDNSPGSVVEAAVDDFAIRACEEGSVDVTPPEATLLDPNGGEVLVHDTEYDVTWTATDNVGVASIDLLLSTDGGMTFPQTIAAGEANDGVFTWTVIDADSKTARIKVVARDAAMNQASDTSDGDFALWGTTSAVEAPAGGGVPDRLVLRVADSNPADGSPRLVYGLPAAASVRVGVYDVNGRLVCALVNGHRSEGYHSVEWDWSGQAGTASPGVYFVRLDGPDGSRTAKIVVAR